MELIEEKLLKNKIFKITETQFLVENQFLNDAHELSSNKSKRDLWRNLKSKYEPTFLGNDVTNNVGASQNVIDAFLEQPIVFTYQQAKTAKIANVSHITIVENNNVFSSLKENFPDKAFIQGAGNPNSAVQALIERCDTLNIPMTYIGDIDFNGLKIAQTVQRIVKNSNVLKLYESSTIRSQWFAQSKTAPKPSRISSSNEKFTFEYPSLQTTYDYMQIINQMVEQEDLLYWYFDNLF